MKCALSSFHFASFHFASLVPLLRLKVNGKKELNEVHALNETKKHENKIRMKGTKEQKKMNGARFTCPFILIWSFVLFHSLTILWSGFVLCVSFVFFALN